MMTTTSTPTDATAPAHASTPAAPSTRADVLGGLATAVAAAIAALVTFLLLGAAGVDLVIPVEPGSSELTDLGAGPVLGATFVPMLLGAVLFAVLRRRTANAGRTFAIVVGIFSVLSLAPVLGLDAGTANAVGLGLLHVVVGALAALGLPRVVERLER